MSWRDRVKFIYRPHSFWIGWYWKREKHVLYIFMLPMLGIEIDCVRFYAVAYAGAPELFAGVVPSYIKKENAAYVHTRITPEQFYYLRNELFEGYHGYPRATRTHR